MHIGFRPQPQIMPRRAQPRFGDIIVATKENPTPEEIDAAVEQAGAHMTAQSVSGLIQATDLGDYRGPGAPARYYFVTSDDPRYPASEETLRDITEGMDPNKGVVSTAR